MLIRGDARQIPLTHGCVDCVVTSPPYFGLRDYGITGQIGLESSPDAYVQTMVGVFREVWRVLKAGGTCWLNLGDSYTSGLGETGRNDQGSGFGRNVGSGVQSDIRKERRKGASRDVLPTKNLIGIPWRVAFALQADGWYLRSDIIWHKPNPMPESVTDRPTKAHEYVFLLTKSARYFYDAVAVREPYALSTIHEAATPYDGASWKDYAAAGVQSPGDTKRRILAKIAKRHTIRPGIDVSGGGQGAGVITYGGADGRNKRSVWTIPTAPYAGDHFATMPERLIEPCILAGCRPGGLVCDPFVGSGTVGAVASRLGRRWVGLDLRYQELAGVRTAQRGLLFADAPA